MNTLVTGGAGFIGSRIAHALIQEGHHVTVFDSFVTGHREFVPNEADLIEADLRDLEAVKKATTGIDIVFHQGALRSVERSVDDPIATDDSNVRGTLHVLMASEENAVKKVVYASSSSVYGDTAASLPPEQALTEDMRPDPISPYAVSKLAGENYCRAWTHTRGLSTISLRYFNVYGPGQPRESKYALVFPAFIGALVQGNAPELHWDGEQSRDFTYIDDVVDANLRAATTGEGVLNIAAGNAHTVNEVLRAIQDALGTSIGPIRKPKRAGDVRRTFADISKAKRILGWEPKADWADSVALTTRWFR